MQQEAEHMMPTTEVKYNSLEARQTSLHGEVGHMLNKESRSSAGQVRLEEKVTSWLWNGKADKDSVQTRTVEGDQLEVRKSSIHDQGEGGAPRAAYCTASEHGFSAVLYTT